MWEVVNCYYLTYCAISDVPSLVRGTCLNWLPCPLIMLPFLFWQNKLFLIHLVLCLLCHWNQLSHREPAFAFWFVKMIDVYNKDLGPHPLLLECEYFRVLLLDVVRIDGLCVHPHIYTHSYTYLFFYFVLLCFWVIFQAGIKFII